MRGGGSTLTDACIQRELHLFASCGALGALTTSKSNHVQLWQTPATNYLGHAHKLLFSLAVQLLYRGGADLFKKQARAALASSRRTGEAVRWTFHRQALAVEPRGGR